MAAIRMVRKMCLTKLFPMLLAFTFLALFYASQSLPSRVLLRLGQRQRAMHSLTPASAVTKEHSHNNAASPGNVKNSEKLTYSWRVEDNNGGGKVHMKYGRPFGQELVRQLELFKLSDLYAFAYDNSDDDYKAKLPGTDDGAVFVTAAHSGNYASLRVLIASIKRRFGKRQRIVVYDLGGIGDNWQMMDELDAVCGLELRKFDFDLLPASLRKLRINSWKIYILAQSFAEFQTFIWCDASVEIVAGDYRWHFNMLNKRKLSPFLFTQSTYHGILRATHPTTLAYLPLYKAGHEDIEMHETDFIIVQRSEFTRKLLKWALLCAMTPDCIGPTNYHGHEKIPQQECQSETLFDKDGQTGICHRFDQSVLSILVHNAEAEEQGRGNPELITHASYNHPSRRFVVFPFTNHVVKRNRSKSTTENIAQLYKCP